MYNSSNLRTYLTHLKDKLYKIECNIILYKVNPIVCWTTSFPTNEFNHLYTNKVYKYGMYISFNKKSILVSQKNIIFFIKSGQEDGLLREC